MRSHSLPWTRPSLVLCAVVVAAGAALVASGWYQASDEVAYDDQVLGLGMAIGGAALAAIAAAAALLGARSAVARREVAALERMMALPSPTSLVVVGVGESGLVAGPEMRRFHRADCELARGRGWDTVSRSVHEAENRTPCGMCQP